MSDLVIVPEELRRQAMAFPDAVERRLAEIETPQEAEDDLHKAVAFQTYVKQLKAGIEIEKPIAIGVLKLKAKIGELSPPQKGGRGKKGVKQLDGFTRQSLAAYRQLSKHKAKLDKWCQTVEDVPTQGEFLRFVNGAHVSKNSGQSEWYTPQHYIDDACKVMGGIDLDPASCREAQKVVQAERHFTEKQNGLTSEWFAGTKLRIWMNPPYSQPLITEFCKRLADEIDAQHVQASCVLVNNATETEWFFLLSSRCTAICFPRGRVKFWHPERESAPLQGQALIYYGRAVASFMKTFASYGKCLHV